MSTPVRIYLLCSCSTVLEGVFMSQMDSMLSPKGEEEARQWGEYFISKEIGAVWSSPFGRSLNTARIISRTINMHFGSNQKTSSYERITALPVSELQEISFGLWEGRSRKDVIRQYGDLWKQWENDPVNVSPPNGETLTAVAQRVCSTFSRLCKETREKKAAILVGHQIINKVILAHCMNMPLRDALSIQQDVASMNIISYYEGIANVIEVNLPLGTSA